MKKMVAFILTVILCLGFSFICFAENETKTEAEITDFLFDNKVDLELNVNGAYLIEASSGAVLYSYQPFTEASPASVTKIMTLLLVCEALEEGCFKLTDNEAVDKANKRTKRKHEDQNEGERNGASGREHFCRIAAPLEKRRRNAGAQTHDPARREVGAR